MQDYEAVVIGVSAGGMKALRVVLAGLDPRFDAPLIIVQHRMESSDNYFITYLDQRCRLKVKEAEEKEKITRGIIYIAPANYHLLIEKGGTFSLTVDEPVKYSRPSVDVLFETAARAYKNRLIAVILTGANSDGSAGIVKVKAAGGLTIAQNPETALSPVMPQAAIATGAIDFILELNDIPVFLTDLLGSKYGVRD
ncbi:chemotaxis protein CheB [Desulfopila sp. IMCC35008]|uniref:chemotaxis protein CheB n=1 Tax=Desulfopila sp. IMCC35008 TaxID=2653858 RepID=UPI0013D4C7AF|nr:chemotaxis protein CheB [Desulfopila sp. IMCC35008]